MKGGKNGLLRHVVRAHLKKPLCVCSSCGLGFRDGGCDYRRFKDHRRESHKIQTMSDLSGSCRSTVKKQSASFLLARLGLAAFQFFDPGIPRTPLKTGSRLNRRKKSSILIPLTKVAAFRRPKFGQKEPKGRFFGLASFAEK